MLTHFLSATDGDCCQTNRHAPIPPLVSMPTSACTHLQVESDNLIQVKVLAGVNSKTSGMTSSTMKQAQEKVSQQC